MTPSALADIHGRAFAGGAARAWSEAEFAELIASPLIFVVHRPGGFAMGRAVADEAELLTIATDPTHRRQGIGKAILTEFHAAAAERGATRVFLEVAADNRAARALYDGAGYLCIGQRRGYYTRPDHAGIDALVMERAVP